MNPADRDSHNLARTATRRGFIGAATAVATGASIATTALARQDPARQDKQSADGAWHPDPVPVVLDDAALLTAFMKLRSSSDGRLTVGWMDAVTHAFIDGESFPLYRLLAATWNRHERQGPERYVGRSLEVAFYLDPTSGELLQSLSMPNVAEPVSVPLYRSAASKVFVAVHAQEKREFTAKADGQTFFRPGTADSRQDLNQAQRVGDLFSVREDAGSRMVPADAAAPAFFYREYGIWRGSWKAVMDPRIACVPTEVLYSSAAAYRPWMKMGKAPGHTLQNGVGGKVQRAADLPPRLLELVRAHQGDLLVDPEKALAG
jgi:hypothetical protein